MDGKISPAMGYGGTSARPAGRPAGPDIFSSVFISIFRLYPLIYACKTDDCLIFKAKVEAMTSHGGDVAENV